MSINGKSLIATILPTLNDIGKTCFGRFQSPTDFTPKYPGYSYGFTAQRIHSDVISLQCHPAYTDDTEFYEYEISKSQWSYKGNLITNTDLQAGKDSIKREIDKTVSKYIAFPRPFSVIPVVTVNAETVVLETRMHATNITSSGFTLYVASGNSDTVMTIDWIAVLP